MNFDDYRARAAESDRKYLDRVAEINRNHVARMAEIDRSHDESMRKINRARTFYLWVAGCFGVLSVVAFVVGVTQ